MCTPFYDTRDVERKINTPRQFNTYDHANFMYGKDDFTMLMIDQKITTACICCATIKCLYAYQFLFMNLTNCLKTC